jgi:hypothetical protein
MGRIFNFAALSGLPARATAKSMIGGVPSEHVVRFPGRDNPGGGPDQREIAGWPSSSAAASRVWYFASFKNLAPFQAIHVLG